MREITKNWQKKAKIELVKKGMNMKDLAKATGQSVEYLNSIVNGRVFSAQAIKAVNRELGINDEETMRFLQVQLNFIRKDGVIEWEKAL